MVKTGQRPPGRMVAVLGTLGVVAVLVLLLDGRLLDGAGSANPAGPLKAPRPLALSVSSPASGAADTRGLPAAPSTEPESLDVGRSDCSDVLESFLAQRDHLRRLHDDAVMQGSLAAFRARLDERVAAVDSQTGGSSSGQPSFIFGSLPRMRALDVAFQSMQECAERVGLSEALKQLLIVTFRDETRVPLQELWLRSFSFYNPCDHDVFYAVHACLLEGLPDGLAPSLRDALALCITLAAGCDELGEVAFLDLLGLMAGRDKLDRALLWSDIAATQPYSRALGRMLVQAIKDDAANAYGALEALRFFAASGDGVLQSLFESEPELLSQFLVDGAGSTEAWVFCEMLGEFGGPWGVSVVLHHVANPALPPGARAAMLAMLGDSPDMHWGDFRELIGADPVISSAAFNAIGQKAQSDPDALAWLQAQALDGAGENQADALRALSASGAEGLSAFFRQEVMPGAQDDVRNLALELYISQPDADPEWLASMTDPSAELHGELRLKAAIGHLLVTRDLDASLDLIESMVNDPDADTRFSATLILDHVLNGKGDQGSLERWSRMDSAGYQLKRMASGADVEHMLEALLVGGDPALTSSLAERMRGSPSGLAQEQRAYLVSLLQQFSDP